MLKGYLIWLLFSAYQVEKSLRFFVIGDWGGLPEFPYRTYVEAAVAARMAKLAHVLDIHFLLALGDNFYYGGVKNVADPRFKVTHIGINNDNTVPTL